ASGDNQVHITRGIASAINRVSRFERLNHRDTKVSEWVLDVLARSRRGAKPAHGNGILITDAVIANRHAEPSFQLECVGPRRTERPADLRIRRAFRSQCIRISYLWIYRLRAPP